MVRIGDRVRFQSQMAIEELPEAEHPEDKGNSKEQPFKTGCLGKEFLDKGFHFNVPLSLRA